MKTLNRKEIEKVNKLLEGSNGVIIATTNGSGVIGNGLITLNLLANLVSNIKECGMKESDIKNAVDCGLHHKDISVDKLDKKELDKIAKEIVKDLKSALDEMFSEEDKD